MIDNKELLKHLRLIGLNLCAVTFIHELQKGSAKVPSSLQEESDRNLRAARALLKCVIRRLDAEVPLA